MKKPNTLTVTISEPCTQNWDNMTANGNGRHCGSCNKTVVDFSTFTDKQLVEFLNKIKGEVCGRISPYHVNRPMLVPVKSNNLAWNKILFGAAFVAGIVAKGDGQVVPQIVGQVKIPFVLPENIALQQDTSKGLPQNMIDQINTIEGGIPGVYSDVSGPVIIDEQPIVDSSKHIIKGFVKESKTGNPIEYAYIYVNDQYMANADVKGEYSFFVPDSLMNQNITVRFSAFEHETREVTIRTGKPVNLNADLNYKREEKLMGKMQIRRQ